MMVLMIMFPISVIPALYFFDNYGLIIPLVLFILFMFSSLQLEKIKKGRNLKTYRQIVVFIEGKPVSKEKPNKKDKILNISLIFASALISFIVVYLGMSVFGI